MLTTLSPWLCLPMALVFAVAATFLLCLTLPLWRRDPGQDDHQLAVCRAGAVLCAFTGSVVGILAIAYGHAALYGWGVL